MAERRIKKELKDLAKNPEGSAVAQDSSQYENEVSDEKISLVFQITGNKNSPYHNGKFDVMIEFPNDYPEERYTVKFVTTIYHPNVAATGNVCNCDYGILLQDSSWDANKPHSTLRYALKRVQEIVGNPDPYFTKSTYCFLECSDMTCDCLNQLVQQDYFQSVNAFEQKASFYANKFADSGNDKHQWVGHGSYMYCKLNEQHKIIGKTQSENEKIYSQIANGKDVQLLTSAIKMSAMLSWLKEQKQDELYFDMHFEEQDNQIKVCFSSLLFNSLIGKRGRNKKIKGSYSGV